MKTLTTRILAGLFCALAAQAPALAQTAAYPNKPIELIVPYPAGGGTDVLGRAFAQAAVKHLPQNMIVLNKPGASGAIGWADVINGKHRRLQDGAAGHRPDDAAQHGIHEDHLRGLHAHRPPELRPGGDHRPGRCAVEDGGGVHGRGQEGRFPIGNGGNGSTWHLAAAAVEDKTGAKFNHIPYAGAQPGHRWHCSAATWTRSR